MRILIGDAVPIPPWFSIPGMALTGPPGFWLAGMVYFQPIGLRLDENGVSGYFMAPFVWREVQEVRLYQREPYENPSDNGIWRKEQEQMFLAFRLAYYDMWWVQNAPIQRFILMLRGQPAHWDIVVPLASLNTPDPKEVVHLASQLLERR